MRYAINLSKDGHILSATEEQFAPVNSVIVDYLPNGDISDYCYIGGKYIYDPLPVPDSNIPEIPSNKEGSIWDELDAAYQEGVDSV